MSKQEILVLNKNAEYPECSGDPADCPENEGYGCCKPNPKNTAVSSDVETVVSPRYWVCIIGPVDNGRLSDRFDAVPRKAAMDAIARNGIEIKNCWSGWGCDEKHFQDIMKVWNKE